MDAATVPVDFAGFGRQQPQQDPQQRRLARANATGYNGKTPLLQSQVDIENALL